MFVGALAGFKISLETGNPWLGLILAMVAGMALSLLHAIVCIHFQADQIVSGLALTFVGTGVALVLGEGLATAADRRPAADPDPPRAVADPVHRPCVLHRPERPRLPRLPAGPGGIHLDRPHPTRDAPPGGGRAAVGGGRPGCRRLPHSLRLYPGWGRPGRAGRCHHQHGGDPGLVRGQGDVRVGLDRGGIGRSSPSGARVGR